MLPWLAFSEAIGRAPGGILENRVLVKKVVFPLEILPVTHVISGLGHAGFRSRDLHRRAARRSAVTCPATIAWLPLLLIPQLLFTLGLAWFSRRRACTCGIIGQMIGFLLTLVVFSDSDLL